MQKCKKYANFCCWIVKGFPPPSLLVISRGTIWYLLLKNVALDTIIQLWTFAAIAMEDQNIGSKTLDGNSAQLGFLDLLLLLQLFLH